MALKTVSASGLVRAALVAGVAALPLLAAPAVAQPPMAASPLVQGQISLADLAERVMPAVVNISAVTTSDTRSRN
ncbi:hypothetical protein AB4084_41965, partial [Lysobacter sp. 2RAB21]